jgi:hypothetical protein
VSSAVSLVEPLLKLDHRLKRVSCSSSREGVTFYALDSTNFHSQSNGLEGTRDKKWKASKRERESVRACACVCEIITVYIYIYIYNCIIK